MNEDKKKDIRKKFAAASLPVRAVSALVYAALLVGCTIAGAPFYFVFVFLASILCLREVLRIFSMESRSLKTVSAAIHLAALLWTGLSLGYAPGWMFGPRVEVLILPLVFILFPVGLLRAKGDASADLGKVLLAMVYVTLPFALSLWLPFAGGDVYDFRIPLGVFLLLWACDTFAYLFGISLGRHKLMERISPKKTVEGFVGGLAATLACGYALSAVFPGALSAGQWMAVAGVVAVAGVAGDLVESMFKRGAGVKDSGRIMPGHGGMLDRLDSFILSVPFIYTLLYLW